MFGIVIRTLLFSSKHFHPPKGTSNPAPPHSLPLTEFRIQDLPALTYVSQADGFEHWVPGGGAIILQGWGNGRLSFTVRNELLGQALGSPRPAR